MRTRIAKPGLRIRNLRSESKLSRQDSAFPQRSSILRCRCASALPPLVLKELDYAVLKCGLVGSGAVVAFTFAGARGWDCFEKSSDP